MSTCISSIIPPIFATGNSPDIRIKVERSYPVVNPSPAVEPSSPAVDTSIHNCYNWDVTGAVDLRVAMPLVNFPASNSASLDCVKRAKSFCAGSATFDTDQCTLINVTGSFPSGVPLLEEVQFNCSAAYEDIVIVPQTCGFWDVIVFPISQNLMIIIAALVLVLLVAVMAVCCIIKRRISRSRQNAGSEASKLEEGAAEDESDDDDESGDDENNG